MRDRPHHALPERSGHRLWIVQGTVRRDEFEDRPGEKLLGRRAIVVWKSRDRSNSAVSTRFADGYLTKRSGSPLLRIAVSASHARQRRDLGEDFSRPDRASIMLPGSER